MVLKKLLRGVGVLSLLPLLLTSCQTTSVQREEEIAPPAGIRFQLVYIIHGDGSYLFHTADGESHYADRRVLDQAFRTAAALSSGEVFIFHQKPRGRFLFFTQSRDGKFYHYRNGEIMNKSSYRRRHTPSLWDEEYAYFRHYRADNRTGSGEVEKPLLILLFFGHQVFETDGAGYHSSYPDEPFSTRELADSISLFTASDESTGAGGVERTPADLVVLSTCIGGTVGTLKALAPLSRFVIASPESLHLSHMDMSGLQGLETWNGNDLQSFLTEVVWHAFTELTHLTSTVVSIALYDTAAAPPLLDSVSKQYEEKLRKLERDEGVPLEYYDCIEDPLFPREYGGEGVFILYRAPLFGRDKNKRSHSGWECWK